MSAYLSVLVQLVALIGVPGLLWLAWTGVAALKMRGYRTTYAEALLRAVGAAAAAAGAAGTTLFTPEGRTAGLAAGASYMQQTVGQVAGPALGIVTVADHTLRVENQLNAMELQSDLTARATVTAQRVAADDAASGLSADYILRHQGV